ncbi:hypothetical protein [Streptomyces viridochromogenes]|nr:hypothetical protein [Streptomyces viridochromogenes]
MPLPGIEVNAIAFQAVASDVPKISLSRACAAFADVRSWSPMSRVYDSP